VELSRVNVMAKKKRKKQKGKKATDFQVFVVAFRRLFPKGKVSLKLLKTIWRNKPLRALMIRLMVIKSLSRRSPKKSRKTRTQRRRKTKTRKTKRKKRAKRKTSASTKGKKKVSFIAKSGPNKGKRVTFFVKR